MKNMTKAFVAVALIGSVTTATMAESTVNQSAFAKTVTVKQALTMKDDSKVQIKGHVVKSVGDEKYQFRDNTGSINVEIDD
ncbi:NirD/YgiW/YdeI family stress tolerance protein, partial [Acinetobacter johnsonii]